MTDRFDEIRASIAANDKRIVDAVNERLRLVAELWAIKEERSLPLSDPERERALHQTLAAANGGPISSAGLERLVDVLLELTRSELAADAGGDRG